MIHKNGTCKYSYSQSGSMQSNQSGNIPDHQERREELERKKRGKRLLRAQGSEIQKRTLPGKRKKGDRKVMNKILKRLLSVVLAVVMVIGLVPLSGVTTVEAANDNNTAGMTIYLDASIVLDDDNVQWDSGSSISATISYNADVGGGSSTVVLDSVQNKDHWYSLTLL